MAEKPLSGGAVFIGFHRLVGASGGGYVPELAGLMQARSARSAEIIAFPVVDKAVPLRRPLLFCEICRFPARVKPAASAAVR